MQLGNGFLWEGHICTQQPKILLSQKSEQGEDGRAEQDQDLLQPRDSELNEDDVKFSVDQLDNQTRVPAPDIIDELGL
ncbi:MAG TPA: hypothetical protein VN207_12000 [Ktedonobacteraceae bacterium]|nr:hypothetical protein [Ktedonobacteraceae bacterium]